MNDLDIPSNYDLVESISGEKLGSIECLRKAYGDYLKEIITIKEKRKIKGKVFLLI